MATERVLHVHPTLAPVFPDGGLRRGSIIACTGQGAWSGALALTATASQSGSWAAVVGLGALGLAAAAEWGLALDRVIGIPDVPASQSATVLAALVDSVDLVLIDGASVRAGEARRISARLVQRGGVLVLVERVGGFSADITCDFSTETWEGLGDGYGRLTARHAQLRVAGRRLGRERRLHLQFPAATGSIDHRRVETIHADGIASAVAAVHAV